MIDLKFLGQVLQSFVMLLLLILSLLLLFFFNGILKVFTQQFQLKIDNVGVREVIRYLDLKNLLPNDIHEHMVVTLGDHAPSYSMVKKWAASLKRGRQSLEDDHHR